MPLLCVNVDHVATIRQARLGIEPDPIVAAAMCEQAGATGIIMHLREDRRHIQDRDINLIAQTIQTKFNFEMAATEEMQAFALKITPATVCLVPEKRAELTTEGGLNCVGHEEKLKKYLAPIHESGIRSSLFIDADPAQIKAAHKIGAEYVEIHTGHFADAKKRPEQKNELKKIIDGIKRSQDLGLKVNLGHGLNYTNILDFADVPGICEYSIGHSIMARAIFLGIDRAVKDMVEIIRTFVN
ncbi:pyridoxine 5'-phosphate synthase [Desulfovibrio sp. UCD-KL4C]|uniref:pyridoxine 5'-phosphate synthase n=1 Tax=Desulfovibrio sp. UCD-KL4C TaxID=2578120 RepID=UPI0025C217E4|nr:pyridoxine 5'-phosphate synthase [Desulfovibrio sp. UCD-KL4C]